MVEFQIAYGFNVRRFLKRTIRVETIEEAERIARAEALERISAESASMENSADFGSHEQLDTYVMVDVADDSLGLDAVEFPMPELDGL